jgi:DNA-directed RNA polymerase subunit RPC12/RpoP
MSIKLTGKCIACGKRFDITPRLMREATDVGCAISPCCGFPSTVVKAKVARSKRAKGAEHGI